MSAEQIHLSFPADAASGVVVSWIQPDFDRERRRGVAYRPIDATGASGGGDWHFTPAEYRPQPPRGWLHRAWLRGLPPDTAVEYRIECGGGASPGPVRRTRTAPAGDAAAYRFAFFADTGLIGRLDGNANGTAAVYEALAAAEPLFLIGGGDYAYANRDGRFASIPAAIDEWFRQAEPLLARFPLYAQYGNHETILKEFFEDWSGRFTHPPGFDGDRSYSFRVGQVHFALLFVPDIDCFLPSHVEWLDADLAAARSAGARRLVVVQHEPIYGHGRSHPARPTVREAIVPVLERHRVDLHLSAHDQNYERTFPLVHRRGPDGLVPEIGSTDPHTYPEWRGVVYAKVSPAGKMSEIGNCFSRFTIDRQAFIAHRDDTAHHYAVVRVTASHRLDVGVYRLLPHEHQPSREDAFSLG